MTRTLIVGGGISGAFAGYFLAASGADVCIVDSCPRGDRASDHNPGGLNPLHGPGIPGPMSAFAMQCYLTHLAEWPRIAELSGMDFNGRLVSRIILAFSDPEAQNLLAARELYLNAEGFHAQWLTREDLRQREPRIGPDILGGLLVTGNAVVSSQCYRRAVLAAACRMGAVGISGEVTAVDCQRGRVSGVRMGSRRMPVEKVVFATGPRMEHVDSISKARVPVRAVPGELLLVRAGANGPAHDITWGQYGIYRHDANLLWLGGTRDKAGAGGIRGERGKRAILSGVSRMMPGLGDPRVLQHTVGARPVTPDGMPVIGPVPGCENAYMVLGGGVKGMLLSSGLGKGIAAMVAGGERPADLSSFRVERFANQPPVAGDTGVRAAGSQP